MSRKRNEWTARLILESLATNFCTAFVTLTYSDECLPFNNHLRYSDVQNFVRKIRYDLRQYDITMRYFFVGEYGDKLGRPHYHALLFFNKVHPELDADRSYYLALNFISVEKFITSILDKLFRDNWSYGLYDIQLPERGAFHYVAKYAIKSIDFTEDEKSYRERMLCSLKPTIGSSWLTDDRIKWFRSHPDVNYLLLDGYKFPLPRSFRKKIHPPLKNLSMQELKSIELQQLQFENDSKLTNKLKTLSSIEVVNFFNNNTTLNQRLMSKIIKKKLT